jgi:hypothetical protein
MVFTEIAAGLTLTKYGFNGGLLCLRIAYSYRSSPNRLFEVPTIMRHAKGKVLTTQFSGGKKLPPMRRSPATIRHKEN